MQLSELYLDRFLYKDNLQNLETKDAIYNSSNVVPGDVPSIAAGGAAQDINMGNVFINGAQLEPGTVPQTVLDVANWGWGQTCAFSVASATQVNWGAGTFKSADGTSYSISAGNTGTMSAKTYIYLDILTSITVYQKTTTPGDAVGIGKVLVAVAKNGASSATFNLNEAEQIVGDNILANTINASKITAGTITATQISSGYVYAGTINADNITTGTLTGRLVRTSTGANRVQLNNSTQAFEAYSGGDLRAALSGFALTFLGPGEVGSGSIYGVGTASLALDVGDAGLYITETAVLPWSSGTYSLGDVSTTWSNIYTEEINIVGDVTQNGGGSIVDTAGIYFTAKTTNPGTNGQLKYYVSGGSEGLRVQFGGFDFQLDATGV